jgi:hypothetical protein
MGRWAESRWQLCRVLREDIRQGHYEPGQEHLCWIPKRSGNGKRPLIIQCIDDRVVQRATLMILQPLLDPRFDPRSFGFRPDKGTLDALALAERLAVDQKRWVWLCADLKDAFCNVNIPRLMDVVRRNLPDEDLADFISRLLKGARLGGLRQGGPLSPLLLNVYLDHFLDRKWRKLFPAIPLIRYADDLLLLCRTPKKAVSAYKALVNKLRPAGMTLKEDVNKALCRLDLGEEACYMGFALKKGAGRLHLGLTRDAWTALEEHLEDAHEAPESALRAAQCVMGWLSQRGACLPDLGVEKVYARVRRIAHQLAFDELLYPFEVQEVAKDALKRWEDARRSARAASGKTT